MRPRSFDLLGGSDRRHPVHDRGEALGVEAMSAGDLKV
jgi:hypothetical protein